MRLPHAEKALLASVIPQLRMVVQGEAGAEHLRGRLFPPAYEDPELEREFRRLVGDDLLEQRLAALDTTLATLETGHTKARQWVVELDAEQAQSWLAVLHDLRLVLAQIAGITTEADWDRKVDGSEPTDLVLWHVGALQEELLGVLTGGLNESRPPDR